MIQKESDLPPTIARAAGGSEANKPGSSARVGAAAAAVAPSSQLWLGLRDPRIVRVSRALGGKDRHSKVSTVRGLRDRRVRLSVQTAIQLYDLQDRLGLSQPSKVVDWLLNASQHEIDKLPPLHFPSHFPQIVGSSGNSFGTMPHDRMLRRDTSSCSTSLSKEEDHQRHRNEDVRAGAHEESRGVDPAWNSTAVSYYHSSAADHDHTLPDGSSSTVTAAVQLMPGSYALQPSVSVPSDDPSSYLYYNHRLAVAAPAPSQLSLLPVLSGIKPQTTSSPPAALLFCTPGTIAMPHSLIQAYATSASAFDPNIQDHFHSACSTTTATAGTRPRAAPQSYLLPSTNSDSFPAAAPSSTGRLLS